MQTGRRSGIRRVWLACVCGTLAAAAGSCALAEPLARPQSLPAQTCQWATTPNIDISGCIQKPTLVAAEALDVHLSGAKSQAPDASGAPADAAREAGLSLALDRGRVYEALREEFDRTLGLGGPAHEEMPGRDYLSGWAGPGPFGWDPHARPRSQALALLTPNRFSHRVIGDALPEPGVREKNYGDLRLRADWDHGTALENLSFASLETVQAVLMVPSAEGLMERDVGVASAARGDQTALPASVVSLILALIGLVAIGRREAAWRD